MNLNEIVDLVSKDPDSLIDYISIGIAIVTLFVVIKNNKDTKVNYDQIIKELVNIKKTVPQLKPEQPLIPKWAIPFKNEVLELPKLHWKFNVKAHLELQVKSGDWVEKGQTLYTLSVKRTVRKKFIIPYRKNKWDTVEVRSPLSGLFIGPALSTIVKLNSDIRNSVFEPKQKPFGILKPTKASEPESASRYMYSDVYEHFERYMESIYFEINEISKAEGYKPDIIRKILEEQRAMDYSVADLWADYSEEIMAIIDSNERIKEYLSIPEN